MGQEETIIREALALANDHSVQDLSIALEAVQIKKMLLPSQRTEDASPMIPSQLEYLPTYSEAR